MNRMISFIIGFSLCISISMAENKFIALSVGSNALYSVSGGGTVPTLIGNLGGKGDFWEVVQAGENCVYFCDRVSDHLFKYDIVNRNIIGEVALDRNIIIQSRGLDVSPDGTMYGVFSGLEVRRIDPKTGKTSLVTKITGTNQIEAMAFSPDGILYAMGSPKRGASSDCLYTIDLKTGKVSLVGKVGCDIDSLTFGSDGNLYGADAKKDYIAEIYRIDPHTASLTNIGSSGVSEVNGLLAVPKSAELSIEYERDGHSYLAAGGGETSQDYNLLLTQAVAELEQAKKEYESLLNKEKELKKDVAIKEAGMRTAQAKADAVSRQEVDARKSKDRAEGQYNSTYFDSGARRPAAKSERDATERLTRGTTTKTGEAIALAEKKRILYELASEDLNKVQVELNKTRATLDEKTRTIERLRKGKILQGLSLSDSSDNQSLALKNVISSNYSPKAGDIITNSIGIKLVYIPAGEFMMGSDTGQSDEKPVHKVRITEGFYMGKTEVTQAQYNAVMDINPSHFKGANLPADSISWNDAMEFCQKLSEKEGKYYTLPTEAQWEYACRAGTKTELNYCRDGARDLSPGGWFKRNSGNRMHPVAQKKPNAWGLCDMHGNVWEWCKDFYGSDYYNMSPETDPENTTINEKRVIRGGCFKDPAGTGCRSANRHTAGPADNHTIVGLRVVMSATTLYKSLIP